MFSRATTTRFLFFVLIQLLIGVSSSTGEFHINNEFSRLSMNKTFERVEVIRQLVPENLLKIYGEKRSYRELDNDLKKLNVNDQCEAQFSSYIDGLFHFEFWALKMMDASSKIPTGILIGNMKDLGQYDECVSIKESKEQIGLIRGRHCMYTVSVVAQNLPVPIFQQLSICMPSACDTDDVTKLLRSASSNISDKLPISFVVDSVTCSDVDPKSYSAGEIIVILLSLCFLCFLASCTVYDVFIRATRSNSINNSCFTKFRDFSFYTNLLRIFDTTKSEGTISVIQGLRFFSLAWVILGHEYSTPMMGALINLADVPEWMRAWSSIYVRLGPFAVDTFFTLSGFLTSHLFLKEMAKGRPFNLIMYYVHRYIRLTPALAAMLLISIYLAPRWGSGSLWQFIMGIHKEECEQYWWSFILYIQNYVNSERAVCLGHTWYLAVDMQLFWISPLILYPLAKKPKIGLIILIGAIIESIIAPAVYTAQKSPTLSDATKPKGVINTADIATYLKTGPWLLGVFLGYILSKKPTPSNRLIISGWIAAFLAFAFIFFSYRIFQSDDYVWNKPWEVFYAAMSKHIWSFGVCWIIYASVTGYGGIINKILSWPFYSPFAKISYSIYLVHFLIMFMKNSSARAPIYFTDGASIYAFFGEFVVCSIAGLALSLVFESPFLTLEKMIFRRQKTSAEQPKNENV